MKNKPKLEIGGVENCYTGIKLWIVVGNQKPKPMYLPRYIALALIKEIKHRLS